MTLNYPNIQNIQADNGALAYIEGGGSVTILNPTMFTEPPLSMMFGLDSMEGAFFYFESETSSDTASAKITNCQGMVWNIRAQDHSILAHSDNPLASLTIENCKLDSLTASTSKVLYSGYFESITLNYVEITNYILP